MRITKINTIQNFKATLCGDYKQVIALSKEDGLPEEEAEQLINEVHTMLPNKKDRVFFIFRKRYPEDFIRPFMLRSQVEVLKDGDVFNSQGLRANVYPYAGEQKDLLPNFVSTLRKILNGEKNSEKTRYFFSENKDQELQYRYNKRINAGNINFDEGLEI